MDSFISSLPTPLYWLLLGLSFFFLIGCILSVLGMLLPLLLLGAVVWFLMGCARDPRFLDVVKGRRGGRGPRRF
ncbi:hypothetical protein L2W58_09190 [Dethiosulfovibrio sp. F2B]|uniref:hypothetical protein n=1 Tax=Dethiosulfovibrio faecalis TaxID=2720018 RepID=UPI001F24837B|nr:hypothetical protein [Dethiosulfovibrio faecalis]MCF4151971.1 hypothetical protein [Dethiosulfovibrio faecalis]